MIAADLAAIPGFLTGLPRWLVWRNESRGGKQTKVPKTARNTAATSTSPDTWASFDAIANVIRRQPRLFDGPGIVLGDLGNGEHLCGIDLDSCLNDDGALADWAEPFGVCLPTFGEVSPSERGLKFFFRCRADDARTVRAAFGIPDKAWGCKRSIGANGANHGPGVEIYLGPGRFFTVTGKQWPLAPDEVALLDHATLLRLAKLVPKPPVGFTALGVVRIARAAQSPSAGARPCADKARHSSKCARHCAPIPKPPSGARRKARPTMGASCDAFGQELRRPRGSIAARRMKGAPLGQTSPTRSLHYARLPNCATCSHMTTCCGHRCW